MPGSSFDSKTELTTYSGQQVLAHVRHARDESELRLHLAEARRRGWIVSVRAGQMAFDTQAIGEDMVIQLGGFDAVGQVVDGTITVGANAR
jgi:hypothetical protein